VKRRKPGSGGRREALKNEIRDTLHERRFTNIVVSFILAVILLVGSGCRNEPGPPGGPQEKVTIAYSTAPNAAALVHIAFSKGFFADEGLQATPQPHAFGKMALDALLEGKADLATAADTPVMSAVMYGRKITILASIGKSTRNEAIVARRDRGVENPPDLKGKTIAVTRGTTSDFFADVFLSAHGIGSNEVKIVNMRPSEVAGAIKSGRIDAASTWNPLLTELQEALGEKARTFYAEKLYTEMFCLVAGQDFVAHHPGAVRKVLRALIKAEVFAKEHPEESRRLVADFVKVDQPVIDKIWDLYGLQVTLDQALLVNLEDQSRWAVERRLTPRSDIPDYLDFIYIDGLSGVKSQAVRILK
jgi:sulfonate transport system substrate-binding protein